MKKYISTVVLLVAGTAFVNADTSTGAVFNTVLETEFENYKLGDSFSIQATLSGLPQNAGFVTLADNYYIVNESHKYWGLNDTSDNNMEINDGIVGNGKWKLSVEGNNYTYTSTEETLPILWTQNADGNGSATRNVGAALTLNISSDGTDSTIRLSYTGTSIVDIFVLDGIQLNAKNIRVADSITSVTNTKITYTPVPEPSAFGLLAGIGALALVASRRRRK